MKNLLPISKLYNFNVKVFKNLSVTFILTFFTSLIFFSINVEASVWKVSEGSSTYNVYFVGNTLGGLGGELDPQIQQSGVAPGCYYNGVDSSGGRLVAYDSSTDKFTTTYERAISPIPNGSAAAKALADKGFCVKIIPCAGCETQSRYTINTDTSKIQYEYFRDTSGWQKLRLSRVPLVGTCPDNWSRSDPSYAVPDTSMLFGRSPGNAAICNRLRIEQGSKPWLGGNGIFYDNCHEALSANGVSDNNEAKRICATFVCQGGDSQVKTQVNQIRSYFTAMLDYDSSSTPPLEGSCRWLTSSTDCNFTSASSCTYDTNTATSDNCKTEGVILNTDTLGVGTGDPSYTNKNLFCSDTSTVVMCDSTVTTYATAFPGGSRHASCVDYTPPSSSCSITPSSSNCTFGNAASSDNCYDDSVVVSHRPTGGEAMNLFCSVGGDTVACRSSISNYGDAFPSATSANQAMLNDVDQVNCMRFTPGMTSISLPPVDECTRQQEGMVLISGGGGSQRPFDYTQYRNCLARSTGADARRSCVSEQTSGGGIFQCLCDVAYNPGYDFWRCTINYDPNSCDPVCALIPTTIGEVIEVKTQRALNPLGLIKTVSDFLFAIAVLIFIVNMLRGSFIYVTSGGEEAKMKEAQTTITNTIFGMVFIVFIGALLRWVITIATTATTATP